MHSTTPIVRDLVFIGGGHSHAIALRHFAMHPIPGVRLTLITNVCDTPYSGMLPGYVAGLYSFDDCHIDLRPLAQWAGATLIVDTAIGLDLEQNRVLCAQHPPIAFDWVSIDIGSTPTTLAVPGAMDHTIPVKPIAQFLTYWDALVQQVTCHPTPSLRLAVVGGGAGGVELALAIQARLHRLYAATPGASPAVEVHLIHRGDRLLEARQPSVGRRLERILPQQGIQVHLAQNVTAIAPTDSGLQIQCQSGLTLNSDRIFWVTQASAAPWLRQSGLATDDQGFIQVNDALQSISHPQVFAAGDVATLVNHPRPKAGVFAVRQGQPLAENLRRQVTGQPLVPFTPQREFLILVGTGDERAIASRGPFTLGPAPWIWRWKDRIDRAFMERFQHLPPPMSAAPSIGLPDAPPPPPCAGCASKVSHAVLERVLPRIQQECGHPTAHPDVVIGLEQPDDAAVVRVPPGQVLVQTVDYFRALVRDPVVLGQIVTHHCLSDLFAMGATPQTALAIATLPYASEAKTEETLFQLLTGAMQVLQQAGATLIGGHTTEGAELAFGLTCNGLAQEADLLRKQGLQPGQALILTKPLGIGTLFAADMQRQAKGRWIEAAIQSMQVSNQQAAQCFRQHQATACTDVTGFGLLGHLAEMIRGTAVAVELQMDALPLLDGAIATLSQGWVSSLHPSNARAARLLQQPDTVAQHPLYPILFDPQTAGGLLAGVPEPRAIACLDHLQTHGYPHSAIIGRVMSAQAADCPIRVVA